VPPVSPVPLSPSVTDLTEPSTQRPFQVVENIRTERFKMPAFDSSEARSGQELNPGDEMGRMLGNSLQKLSKDVYEKEYHFILELIQNADDNLYDLNHNPTLAFELSENSLLALNNEIGFTEGDLRAICDVGESTKKDKPGFIGEKGIGFKAVFSVSDRVEVHSNGFHIRFDVAKRGPLGMVIPDWVARPLDHAQAMTHSSLSSPGFTRDHLHEMKWNTEILLPLIDVRRREPLADQLGMISPLLLLFLQRLRSMVLSSSHSAFNAAVFLCWLFLWCFCNYLLSTFELLPLLL